MADQKFFETQVTINDEIVPIAVQRMTVDQWLAFKTEFRHMQARSARALLAQAGAQDDASFEAALQLETENDIRATRFTRQAITDYVRTREGADLRDDDGTLVVTGADLFEYYGRNLSAISTLLTAIFTEHLLTAAQKKGLRLAPASDSGSAASTAAPSGDRPEPTATNVEPSSSAPNADVTGPCEDGSSGNKVH